MNHTASSHRWAKAAQAGDPKYQDYYYCHDDRTIPDQYDAVVPEVFPATAPGNFTWNEQMHKWVLTSFYPFQWDLNYRNPSVLVSVLSSVLGLANLGVEVFRIDAVPYIWKELGTNCRNLPQVHAIVRMLRIVLECVCPAVVLKGEVVMAHQGACRLLRHAGKAGMPHALQRVDHGESVECACQWGRAPAQRPARQA